jgi:hypothetical protein
MSETKITHDVSGRGFQELLDIITYMADKFNNHTHGTATIISGTGEAIDSGSSAAPFILKL